jgi:hypothetical protein
VRVVRRYKQLKAVADDRAVFNYLWERIATSESDFQQAVVKLKSLTEGFSLSDTRGLLTASKREIKMKALLQDVVRENICTQQQDGIGLDTDVHAEEMARALISSTSPVMSLDQLYAQAIVMQPFFRNKVEKIALRCNAYFSVLSEVDNQSGDPHTNCATIQPWANFKSYAELERKLNEVLGQEAVLTPQQEVSLGNQSASRTMREAPPKNIEEMVSEEDGDGEQEDVTSYFARLANG